MFIKILASIFIILAGFMFGVNMSEHQKIRMNELNSIKKALLLLKSQINYSLESLPTALINISKKSEKPIKNTFEMISKRLIQKDKNGIAKIWAEEFKNINTDLSKEDIETIADFGKALSSLDRKLQIDNIDIVINYIDKTVEFIASKNEQESKMYKSLGVLAGILLVVLMI